MYIGTVAKLGLLLAVSVASLPAAERFDAVVYGATSGGVTAAIAAAHAGARTALLEPGRHVGGMTTGGLSRTDHGRKETIGGLALEFYRRLGRHYGEDVTWYFEPHVAEKVLREWIREAGVQLFLGHRLREDHGVRKRGARIREIQMENGTGFAAAVFIDATYEGDLMAQAKAAYTIGREGTADYGESLAGVRPTDRKHQFNFPVAAYDEKGVLRAGIQSTPRGEIGAADKKVQAYNYRLCFSDNPANRIPFPRLSSYDPGRYALLAAYIDAWRKAKGAYPGVNDLLGVNRLTVPSKADVNNRGPFSTDYIGANWEYPDASYAKRALIVQAHIDYTAGLLHFLANEPAVPESIRKEMAQWGLCADEFIDTNYWPHQLYIREARRMKSDFVMTQRDIQTDLTKPDSIGMGSYNSDSHNVQRYVTPEGLVLNEGNMEVPVEPYQIPYRVLIPKRKEAENLLVPVCVSSSHVAYSTLRMEPVYMILGHAAGVAAKLAIDSGVPVQEIDTEDLRHKLRQQGAVLELRKP